MINYPKLNQEGLDNFIAYLYTGEENVFDNNLPQGYLSAYFFQCQEL